MNTLNVPTNNKFNVTGCKVCGMKVLKRCLKCKEKLYCSE